MTSPTLFQPSSRPTIIPLLIIGSGPSALALTTRLAASLSGENLDVLSDQQHQRACWRNSGQGLAGTCSGNPAELLKQNIMVIDRTGEWMKSWDQHFHSLDISHLRSTLREHLDPTDTESLAALAFSRQCDGDQLQPLKHIKMAAKSTSDHKGAAFNEVDRQFLQCPSTKLFADHCRELVQRFHLESVIHKAEVHRIEPVCSCENAGDNCPLYYLVYSSLSPEQPIRAARVVLAIGSCNQPQRPLWSQGFASGNPDKSSALVQHAEDIVWNYERPESSTRLQSLHGRRILIVGGGLTSAHLSLIACSAGAEHVCVITRHNQVVVQQFDVSSSLIGRGRLHHAVCQLLSTSDQSQRRELLSQWRASGSISPEMWIRMLKLQPKLQIRTNCCVSRIEAVSSSQGERRALVRLVSGEQQVFDQVWCATGYQMNIANEKMMAALLESLDGAETVDGYPVLSCNLEFGCHSNFFVIGAYAALQLGPLAHNLAGAVMSARRLCDHILPHLQQSSKHQHHADNLLSAAAAAGYENMFAALHLEDVADDSADGGVQASAA